MALCHPASSRSPRSYAAATAATSRHARFFACSSVSSRSRTVARGVLRGAPKCSQVEDDARQARLEAAAGLYEQAAEELERAKAHAARAAEHFRSGEVPRGTAHAWATLGHLKAAEDALLAQARDHRERSSV
jgi:hypothetical protein